MEMPVQSLWELVLRLLAEVVGLLSPLAAGLVVLVDSSNSQQVEVHRRLVAW